VSGCGELLPVAVCQWCGAGVVWSSRPVDASYGASVHVGSGRVACGVVPVEGGR
jgi:hypothetical protein